MSCPSQKSECRSRSEMEMELPRICWKVLRKQILVRDRGQICRTPVGHSGPLYSLQTWSSQICAFQLQNAIYLSSFCSPPSKWNVCISLVIGKTKSIFLEPQLLRQSCRWVGFGLGPPDPNIRWIQFRNTISESEWIWMSGPRSEWKGSNIT